MTAHDSHPAPDAPTDQPFERAVAFCLRAYPQRWRATRSAEVTAVLADLAGPPPRRLDARAAAGLVGGGWATRWREHPPLGAYLLYRLFDRRLPARYQAWVRADIDGPLFPLRRVLMIWSLLIPWILVLPRLMVAFDPSLASGGSASASAIPILVGDRHERPPVRPRVARAGRAPFPRPALWRSGVRR